jgi:hypothetical protein
MEKYLKSETVHGKSFTKRFYKENGLWYIDLPEFINNGFGTKANLLMVDGSDKLLDILSRNTEECVIRFKDHSIYAPGEQPDYDAIMDMFCNEAVKPQGEKYISADIARYGSDKMVILVWSGFRVIEIFTLDKSSITETILFPISLNKCSDFVETISVIFELL